MSNKPTIAELEKLLNSEDEGAIEIKPDGSIRCLNDAELKGKRERLEAESMDCLRAENERLRAILRDIHRLSE